MSLERDITEIRLLIDLDEGFSRAKELYVDTIDPETGHGKMPLQLLKRLATKDPTPTKKYIEWMARQYLTHHTMRGFDSIAEFDKLITQNRLEKRDINQYATLEELTNAVDSVRATMGAEREKKKEDEVRKSLIKFDGSVERVLKYRKDLVSDYKIDIPYVTKIRHKMEKEQKGVFGKDFTIDEEIFKEIDRKPFQTEYANGKVEKHPNGDVIFENDKVVIVCPPDEKKSQLYGRNHEYDPNDPQSLDSPWCTSYRNRNCRWQSYYGSQGNTFYIILPKNIDDVPLKKYTKVNVQVSPRQAGETDKSPTRMTVWDFHDATIPKPEYMKLFKAWGIPLQKTTEED